MKWKNGRLVALWTFVYSVNFRTPASVSHLQMLIPFSAVKVQAVESGSEYGTKCAPKRDHNAARH